MSEILNAVIKTAIAIIEVGGYAIITSMKPILL
jgi:hypothetical protein